MVKSIKAIGLSVLLMAGISCSNKKVDDELEKQRQDSIIMAKAAMDAAREAAIIKARIEDSLNKLQQVDSTALPTEPLN